MTNPHLSETYRALPRSEILIPLLFGSGWGISQVLLGISIDRVGMSLTFAIVIGLSATLGTLIPLITLHRDTLLSARGSLILAGIMIMSCGIFLFAKAGKEREEQQGKPLSTGSVRTANYGAALIITVSAGVLTPMLNYALAFGEPILSRVESLGITPANATYSVWVVALLGGLPVNLLYCAYLLRRNRTWGMFAAKSDDWLASILMAALWMGSIALYGIATTRLGTLGTAVGWSLFSIFVVLAATLSGLFMGEWKGVGKRPMRRLGFGLCLLTIASVFIASGNH
jgi:L-rhamnose-H+ transport protein